MANGRKEFNVDKSEEFVHDHITELKKPDEFKDVSIYPTSGDVIVHKTITDDLFNYELKGVMIK